MGQKNQSCSESPENYFSVKNFENLVNIVSKKGWGGGATPLQAILANFSWGHSIGTVPQKNFVGSGGGEGGCR